MFNNLRPISIAVTTVVVVGVAETMEAAVVAETTGAAVAETMGAVVVAMEAAVDGVMVVTAPCPPSPLTQPTWETCPMV